MIPTIGKYHLVGLVLVIGIYGFSLLAAHAFGSPILIEDACPSLVQFSCHRAEINPGANWNAWGVIGVGMAIVWSASLYLANRPRGWA